MIRAIFFGAYIWYIIPVGGARYVPGGAGEEGLPLLGSGGPAHDPFTGGSRYTPSTNTQGIIIS